MKIGTFLAMPTEGFEAPIEIYRCYGCGTTSEKGTFTDYHDYHGDLESISCNTCDSDNTNMDGEGEPECSSCGAPCWWCEKCSKARCGECWKTYTSEYEPLEEICGDCK